MRSIRKKLMEFAVTAVFAAFTSTSLAHPGWSGYSSTPQQVSGVIGEVRFAKSHATIQVNGNRIERDKWAGSRS